MSKLTLDDISDLRLRARAGGVPLPRHRTEEATPRLDRPGHDLLFENRETIRFQIQEMARIEKLISDEDIEGELAAYNPLIPEPGSLSATLFIELTSDEAREWLPSSSASSTIDLRIGTGPDAIAVTCTPDPDHEKQLAGRDHSAVHYVPAPHSGAGRRVATAR
jgi:hypothetical protein